MNGVPRSAGFWRRIVAVGIDSLVLGAFGTCLGYLWFERLAALGSSGRLLGGAIAVAYFGLLNSRIGGGQTLGKRLLGIRVVDESAASVGLARSTLRAFVLLLPFTLNGVTLRAEASPLEISALAVCVLGLGGAIVYLYVFNRRTRQSLHDLTARTFVVHGKGAGAVREPLWKPHLAIAGGWILVVMLAGAPVVEWLGGTETLRGLVDLQGAVQAIVPGAEVGVRKGMTFSSAADGGRRSVAFTQIHVLAPLRPESFEELADRIAEALPPDHPHLRGVDRVTISISYGYDIMISTMHVTENFSRTPREWSERLEQRGKSGSSV